MNIIEFMNLKEEKNNMKKEEYEQRWMDAITKAKTNTERFVDAVKIYAEETKIHSGFLFLTSPEVGEGEACILIHTDDDLGMLMGQMQLEMMCDVRFRNFMMEVVDGYRENRCSDDLIEDACWLTDRLGAWDKLLDGEHDEGLEYLRFVANQQSRDEANKIQTLRDFIEEQFEKDKEEGEA